jgi:transcriptional regulator with XRE-family HTH domain
MAARTLKFSDQLKRLIAESGISRNQISIATGIDPAVLCRFMQGRSGLSIESLDALAKFLGWEVRSKPHKRKETDG